MHNDKFLFSMFCCRFVLLAYFLLHMTTLLRKYWVLFLIPIVVLVLFYTRNLKSSAQVQQFTRDTLQVHQYFKKANYYLYEAPASDLNVESAHRLVLKAKKISISSVYPLGEGESNLMLSNIYKSQNRKTDAMNSTLAAIRIFKKFQLTEKLGDGYSQMGWFYATSKGEMDRRISNHDSAQRYYGMCNSKSKQAAMLLDLADCYMLKGDFLKSQHILHSTLTIFNSIGRKDVQGVYNLLNLTSINLGECDRALSYGMKAVKAAETVNDQSLQMCSIYNRIGLAYHCKGLYAESAKYFDKSIAVAEKFNDFNLIFQLVINIANNSNILGKYGKTVAISENFERHNVGQISDYERAMLDQHLLTAYQGAGDFTNAKRCYERMLAAVRASEDRLVVDGYTVLVRYVSGKRMYATAENLIKEAKAKYRKLESSEGYLNLYSQKVDLKLRQKKYKEAVEVYTDFKRSSDSAFKISREKQVNNLENQYNQEMNLRDELQRQNMTLLLTRNKLQQSQLAQTKRQTNSLYIGVLLLVILLIVSYCAFVLKKRNNEILRKQKMDIDRHNLSLEKLIEEQVKLISEKEWLVKEVNHRVKNNLQIIISLLNFQSKYLKDQSASAAIKDSQNRIRAMSMIHQQLYQSENLRHIDIEIYIKELIAYLKSALGYDKHIEFELQILSVKLEIAQVVSIGLLLNEAITNAMKYAFEGRSDAKITIQLKALENGHYLLVISDNGNGLPPDFDIESVSTLGFTLIKTMAEQLDGQLQIKNENGLELSITFEPEIII